ncbi:MAG: ComF family protein [Candidatus Omnitrophica bacterium]|nr:ComF family protein [Candidatus Omnitrophota bacterium]
MVFLLYMLSQIKDGLLSLVYPPLCPICGAKARDNSVICETCFSGIKKNLPPYCVKCGRSLRGSTENVEICWECSGKDFYYDKSWSAFLYEGAVKEALHLFKYSGKLSISRLFCGLLINFLKENRQILTGIDAVIAVPLHSVKLREREFNQAHMLASAISKEFKIQDSSACLKRAVRTRPQSELDKNERYENVKNTFAVTAQTPGVYVGKNILLVDDLFTTGATLNECGRVLKEAGADSIRCLTFARGA